MSQFNTYFVIFAFSLLFRPFRVLVGMILGYGFSIAGKVGVFFATCVAFVFGALHGIGLYLREGH